MKTFPVIECLNCHATWRRYAKRKLTPSRNCPKCFKQLKIEGQDYVWDDLGGRLYNQSVHEGAEERKSRPRKSIPVKDLVSIDDFLSKDDKDLLNA